MPQTSTNIPLHTRLIYRVFAHLAAKKQRNISDSYFHLWYYLQRTSEYRYVLTWQLKSGTQRNLFIFSPVVLPSENIRVQVYSHLAAEVRYSKKLIHIFTCGTAFREHQSTGMFSPGQLKSGIQRESQLFPIFTCVVVAKENIL